MRNAYLAALYDLASKNDRIIALVADNGAIVYDNFRQEYPGRFFNVGIAEANMISIAAVILERNKIPIKFKRMGLEAVFPKGYGTYHEMKEINGLSKEQIVRAAENLLKS